MISNNQKRIGIMGGTFDPIHIGHLILAEQAYEQFHLEKILFLPSGNPPHKQKRMDGASDQARLDMVRLAIAGNPHFALDTEEMHRSGFTYTYETVRRLKESNPDTEYYFIIGADSLMSFDTWKNPEIICKYCVLLAAVRDQLAIATMQQKVNDLKKQCNAQIYFLETPNMEISSRLLRTWKKENRSIRYFVPDQVADYIENNKLYQDDLDARDD